MTAPTKQELITGIVEFALSSIGHAYDFGGAPGPDGNDPWDCSSMCNYGWGAVEIQNIPDFPAGTYYGQEHGPSTLGWLGWQGSGVGSIDRSQCQAGDLAVWTTHMGICISNTEMVSAANATIGTIRSLIDGFIPGEPLTILRLAVIGPGGISFPIPGIADQGQIDQVIRQIAESSRSLVNVRMQLSAANRPVGRS